MKKTISIILCMVLVVSIVPAISFNTFALSGTTIKSTDTSHVNTVLNYMKSYASSTSVYNQLYYLIYTSKYGPFNSSQSKWDTSTSLKTSVTDNDGTWSGLYSSAQCMLYCCYAEKRCFGKSGPNASTNVSMSSQSGSTNAEKLKNLITNYADPGEHIRCSYDGSYHSVTFLAKTSSGFYSLDRWGDYIGLHYFTWAQFSATYSSIVIYDAISGVSSHVHNYNKFLYYKTEHPHYAVYSCSCGATTTTATTSTSVACDICNAASNNGYYIKNFLFPKVVKTGDDITITGKLYSTENIRWVVGSICDEEKILQSNSGKWPYTLEYDLININDQLDFSALTPGKYYFMLQAQAGSLSEMKNLWIPFIVEDTGFLKNDIVCPDGALIQNEDFDIGGTIDGAYLITWCNATIIDEVSGETIQIASANPQSKNFDISVFNGQLDFSSLEPGTYKFYIKAGTYQHGDMHNIATSFTVESEKNIINYDANGGSNAPELQIKSYGEDIYLTEEIPIKTGYTFQGWAVNSDSSTVVYNPHDVYCENADITLYAVWKINTYTVTFDANGGSGAPASQTKTYGEDLTLSSTVPVKDKYTFVGWATSADAAQAEYAAGTTFTLNKNITLYAVWNLSHVHCYAETVTRKATCTTDGLKTFTCSCGDSYTETIKATGHKNTVRITEKKATCLEKGSEDEYCLDCSELVGTYEILALGHDNSGEWIVEKAATCTENGSKVLYCKRCTEKIDTASITALGHNFVLAEKNEKHPHNELYKCTRCPKTKTVDSVYSEICPECNFTSTVIDAESCKITGYTGELSSLTVPAELGGKKVVSTATSALKANAKLTEVRFEDGITEIGSLTFMNCSSLKKVVVPASVTTIGTYAFYGCAADFAIYCFRDSYAHQYAVDNDIDFVLMDIAETKNSIIDYTHKLIFTQFTMAADMSVLISVPKNVVAIPQASIVNGNRETFGTGSTVTVFENNTFSGEYTVIVNGDLDGDGVSDVLDAVLAERAANGHGELSAAQAYAANNSADTEVDAESYQNVVNRALGA